MKRILLLLIVLIAGLSASAQITGAALNMRTQVKSYLVQEGYVPSIDIDGDIMFKYNGKEYYIAFENYSDMVYVSVANYMNSTDADLVSLRYIANNVECGLKQIRIYLTENGNTLVFECAAFVSSLSAFKRLFQIYMDILEMGKERVSNAYSNSYD